MVILNEQQISYIFEDDNLAGDFYRLYSEQIQKAVFTAIALWEAEAEEEGTLVTDTFLELKASLTPESENELDDDMGFESFLQIAKNMMIQNTSFAEILESMVEDTNIFILRELEISNPGALEKLSEKLTEESLSVNDEIISTLQMLIKDRNI